MLFRNRFVALVALFFLFVPSVFAQEEEEKPKGFQVSFVSAGSGEDAVSSGLVGTLQLTNEKRTFVEVTAQQEQAWVVVGKKLGNSRYSAAIGGSAGHFQGSPWIGPYGTAEVSLGHLGGQRVAASTLQWPCFFAWEPKSWRFENDGKPENTQKMFVGYISSFELSVGPVGLTYARLWFLDEPANDLPGLKYTAKVMRNISVSGSTTYNGNTGKWMFFVGASWSK
ncbi:MAG: hypothetical protein ACM3KM_01315 [Acidobacteriaceae bacterium]